MLRFIHQHPDHFLCFALLISRLGDVISTRLVTPKLTLEANPIVRKLGWKFAILTILTCFIPYIPSMGPAMGAMMLGPFLMVSAANTSKIWIARTLGEKEYIQFLLRMASQSRLRDAMLPAIASSIFIIFLGGVMLVFSPNPEHYAFWFSLGIMLYGFVIILHGSSFIRRIFRQAEALKNAQTQTCQGEPIERQAHATLK